MLMSRWPEEVIFSLWCPVTEGGSRCAANSALRGIAAAKSLLWTCRLGAVCPCDLFKDLWHFIFGCVFFPHTPIKPKPCESSATVISVSTLSSECGVFFTAHPPHHQPNGSTWTWNPGSFTIKMYLLKKGFVLMCGPNDNTYSLFLSICLSIYLVGQHMQMDENLCCRVLPLISTHTAVMFVMACKVTLHSDITPPSPVSPLAHPPTTAQS